MVLASYRPPDGFSTAGRVAPVVVPVYLLWPAVWKVMPAQGADWNSQVPMFQTLPAKALVANDDSHEPTFFTASLASLTSTLRTPAAAMRISSVPVSLS